MPDILHRISINAPRENVHGLVATTDGIARWWTGRPLEGDSTVGSRFGVYFGEAGTPAAVMEVQSDTPDEVVWRVLEGPDAWIDTLITFLLHRAGDGGTTPRRDQPLGLSATTVSNPIVRSNPMPATNPARSLKLGDRPARRGAGTRPALFRMFHTLAGAT
jgi:hypothetical protein